MSFLDLLPVPVWAKSYVVGLMPIIALALGLAIAAMLTKKEVS